MRFFTFHMHARTHIHTNIYIFLIFFHFLFCNKYFLNVSYCITSIVCLLAYATSAINCCDMKRANARQGKKRNEKKTLLQVKNVVSGDTILQKIEKIRVNEYNSMKKSENKSIGEKGYK